MDGIELKIYCDPQQRQELNLDNYTINFKVNVAGKGRTSATYSKNRIIEQLLIFESVVANAIDSAVKWMEDGWILADGYLGAGKKAGIWQLMVHSDKGYFSGCFGSLKNLKQLYGKENSYVIANVNNRYAIMIHKSCKKSAATKAICKGLGIRRRFENIPLSR